MNEQRELRTCFGTREYSKKSKICKDCRFKIDCGKKVKKNIVPEPNENYIKRINYKQIW